MSNLYDQMNFILSGGALRSLVEFLTPKVGTALIVTPKDADLEILDAIGPAPGGLFLQGWAPRLASAFPEQRKGKNFEVSYAPLSCAPLSCAPLEAEWPWAVAIRGKRWTFYILLRENPEAILPELHPTAGLISLWQEHQYLGSMEERLSRMAYMILATKNTLASIFEPMPLDYYAAFLTDVIHESLFPRSISIFKDDGSAITLLKGNDELPVREGIYAQEKIPPTPVVTKRDAPPYEVVLPIVEPYRLYCLTKWDKLPEEEALGFLELVSNLASRSLTINSIRSDKTEDKIASGQYAILALSEALNALKTRKTKAELLSMTADIFTETAGVGECLLVAWDEKRKGYAPLDYRKDGIKTPCDPVLLPSDEVSAEPENQVFHMGAEDFSKLLKCPWPEMDATKLVFPIWNEGRMNGFIAVSSDRAALAEGGKISVLDIVTQFTAFNLKKR